MYISSLNSFQLSSGSMATATTHMTTMNVGGKRKEPLVFEPELIGGLKSMSIKKVACGDMFTACLTGECNNVAVTSRKQKLF